MKRVILVRHAKSSWDDPDIDDHDRPLNSRGRRDAPMMGQRCAKAGFRPDYVLSSTAKRAERTAFMIAAEVGYQPDTIKHEPGLYHADPETLFDAIICTPEEMLSVMLVGHNPGITLLANRLSDRSIDNMPTCSVFCVDFDVENWYDIEPRSGDFVDFDFPKRQ